MATFWCFFYDTYFSHWRHKAHLRLTYRLQEDLGRVSTFCLRFLTWEEVRALQLVSDLLVSFLQYQEMPLQVLFRHLRQVGVRSHRLWAGCWECTSEGAETRCWTHWDLLLSCTDSTSTDWRMLTDCNRRTLSSLKAAIKRKSYF